MKSVAARICLAAAFVLGALLLLAYNDAQYTPSARDGVFVLASTDPQFGARKRPSEAELQGVHRDKPRYTQLEIDALNAAIVRIAEDVLDRIEVGPPACLPRVCKHSYGFRNRNVTSGVKVAFASVPGSGNTWLRSVIRAGTRLYTGSVYNDGKLARTGYEGEFLKATDNATAVVKTHHAFHFRGSPFDWADGVLHVVRSPFDAFLAECNRMLGGHTGVALHEETLLRKCHAWSQRKVSRLYNMYDVFERESAHELRSREEALVRVHLSEDRGMPVATAFYEDFERDFTRTTAHLLAFLKVFIGDADPRTEWPDVYEGLVCALHESQEEEQFHRHPQGPPPTLLFRNETDQPNEVAQNVCKQMHRWWNENKWGKCDGHFQKERPEVVKFKRLHEIPEQLCEPGQRADGT